MLRLFTERPLERPPVMHRCPSQGALPAAVAPGTASRGSGARFLPDDSAPGARSIARLPASIRRVWRSPRPPAPRQHSLQVWGQNLQV